MSRSQFVASPRGRIVDRCRIIDRGPAGRLAILALMTACGSAMAGPPLVTVTDTTPTGAIDDGIFNGGEYGTLSNFYTGAGAGFNGCVGNGLLYMDSDATYLYLGHQRGGEYDGNYGVVFLDTRPGGFTDAQMNDQQDGGRNVASNLCYLANDAFDPDFLPDFAIVFGNFGTVTFELNAGNTPGHLTVVDSMPWYGFGQWEYRLPLAALGITPGVQSDVDFFMALISETAYASNESIPAYAPLQNNGNPGFGDGTFGGTVGTPGYGAYNRFITQGQPCPPSLGAVIPQTNVNSNAAVNGAGNTIFTGNFGYSGQVNALRVTGEYVAFAPSWRSEMRLRAIAPDGTVYDFTTSTANSAGTVTFNNAVATLASLESGSGTWTFQTYESYDDPINPDATWSRLCIGVDAVSRPPAITALSVPSVVRGGSTVAQVTLRAGQFPASTFVGPGAVTINASVIGGGTITLLDNGVAPDAVAGDLIFSGTVNVPLATAAGRYSLSASATDDQGRSATTSSLDLQVLPTCPSGTAFIQRAGAYADGLPGSANNTVFTGSFGTSGQVDSLRLSAVVNSISPYPASDTRIRVTPPVGSAVEINLSLPAAPGEYVIEDFVLPLGAPRPVAGTWTFETIDQNPNPVAGSGPTFQAICIGASPSVFPVATGSVTPTSVLPDGLSTVRYTVTATPGQNPVSTGLYVRVNEFVLGGSAARDLLDNGVFPDAVPGDNVFTGETIVPSWMPPGVVTLPYVVGDAQGRVTQGSPALTFTVQDPLSLAEINGTIDFEEYDAPIWVQNTPTRFGDNIAQAGSPTGNPASVTTGIELAIPLSQLGAPLNLPPGWNFKMGGFLSNGSQDFISNQFIGALPGNTACLMEPSTVDLGTFAGDQFITVSPAYRPSPPSMDGTLDAGYYGAAQWVQSTYSCFGDSTIGQLTNADGSEIDGVYAVVSNGPLGDTLYLFVTGNLWDGNRLNLFFDTLAGQGQQQLLVNNTFNFYGLWGRMTNFRFDAGFDPDYSVTLNAYSTLDTPLESQMHWSTLPTSEWDFPITNFIGRTWNSTPGGGFIEGDSSFSSGFALAINNSNIEGIPGKPILLPTPQRDYAFGSEIDGVWARVDQADGSLRLLITGNIESGFQKLDLFLDVRAGGQNVLASDNLRIANGGLPALAGLTFDPQIAPDYYISVNTGHTPIRVWADAVPIRNDCLICDMATFDGLFGLNWDVAAWNGGDKVVNDPVMFPGTYASVLDPFASTAVYTDGAPRQTRDNWYGAGGLFPNMIEVAVDNSNVAGVSDANAGGSVGDPASVTTGVEVKIDLAELGWDGGPIRLAGWINGYSHGRMSNQVIGGLPEVDGSAHPNLGYPGLVNFGTIAGDQFITIPLGPAPCWVCPVDYDQNGGVDGGDLAAFFADFENGEACADVDGNGGVDGGDLAFFFSLFEAGGC